MDRLLAHVTALLTWGDYIDMFLFRIQSCGLVGPYCDNSVVCSVILIQLPRVQPHLAFLSVCCFTMVSSVDV